MVYNDNIRMSINKHIRANWETKYKQYYHDKNMEWRENNPEGYKAYMRGYMNKRYAFTSECKKLMKIPSDYFFT
jgi:hypothetical protein